MRSHIFALGDPYLADTLRDLLFYKNQGRYAEAEPFKGSIDKRSRGGRIRH